MKKITITAMAVLLGGSNVCGASDIIDTAQVISSRAIVERITESSQVCDPAPPQQNSGSSVVAPILGGVVGGLLGHQVGRGSGQTAATIVGAAGGAVAGSAIANRANAQPTQQCRTVQTSRDVVNGYDVVYRYNGRDANVRLSYNPGNTIRVGISVVPDDRTVDPGRSGNNYSPPPPPVGYPPPPPPR